MSQILNRDYVAAHGAGRRPSRWDTTRGRQVIVAGVVVGLLVATALVVFLTRPAPTKDGSALRSDDFTASVIDPVWQVVDPAGTATVSPSNVGVNMSLPAGESHIVAAGQNNAVRLIQRTAGGNFDVAAKFAAVPGSGQSIGLTFQSGANDWIWIALSGDGTTSRVSATQYGASSSNSLSNTVTTATETALRVRRIGNTWSLYTSRDGTAWTAIKSFEATLAVTAAGPGFATTGSAPTTFAGRITGFSAVGDLAGSAPPVIDAVTAVAKDDTSATVSWTTPLPTTTKLVYGGTIAYGQSADAVGELTTAHQATMSNLACGTTYHFRAAAADVTGNTAAGSDQTVKTPACLGSNLASDEFTGATLDPARWQFSGQGAGVTLTPTGSAVAVTIAGGRNHSLSAKDAPAPMLTQALSSSQFDAYARFDSLTDLSTELQGLVAYRDADNWVSFEQVNGTNNKITLDLSSRINGVSRLVKEIPLADTTGSTWLRLRKSGSSWTPSVSKDGYIWYPLGTFIVAVAPTRIGVSFGNTGYPAPRTVGVLASFTNAATPLPPTGPAPVPAGRTPVITVWYGDSQVFGTNGVPQRWVNVVGNVSSAGSIVADLRYTFDGGGSVPLAIGPDTFRLARSGDFDIELDRLRMSAGKHVVTITATDLVGRKSTGSVTVDYEPARGPQSPTIALGSAGPGPRAQIVDGLWSVTKTGMRTTQPGFDRVLAVGDDDWTGTVDSLMTVTVHGQVAGVKEAGVGLAIGWTGHTGSSTPRVGHPFGALCFYISDKLGPHQMQILASGDRIAARNPDQAAVTPERAYYMRMVSRAAANGMSTYSCRMWPVGTPEPSTYAVSTTLPSRAGSVIVVAYNTDVTVSDVKITR